MPTVDPPLGASPGDPHLGATDSRATRPGEAGPGAADPAATTPGGGEAATGFVATMRTVAVTAVVVAGTLLLGGYVVHAVTSADPAPTPAPSVRTSTNTPADPSPGADPRFRERPGGRYLDPSTEPGRRDPTRGRPAVPGGTPAGGAAEA